MMRPVPLEKSVAVVEALTQEFSEDQLNLIRYVATDSPSSKFYSELKAVCPQLLAISLDPIHLAIVCEYAQWHKKTPGPKLIRSTVENCGCRSTAEVGYVGGPGLIYWRDAWLRYAVCITRKSRGRSLAPTRKWQRSSGRHVHRTGLSGCLTI